MNKDEIKVPHKGARTTFQGTPCFAQERLAFDVGYREGYYDAVNQQSKISSKQVVSGRSELLLSFFLWFRQNGELYVDKSIEDMISIYEKESNSH